MPVSSIVEPLGSSVVVSIAFNASHNRYVDNSFTTDYMESMASKHLHSVSICCSDISNVDADAFSYMGTLLIHLTW